MQCKTRTETQGIARRHPQQEHSQLTRHLQRHNQAGHGANEPQARAHMARSTGMRGRRGGRAGGSRVRGHGTGRAGEQRARDGHALCGQDDGAVGRGTGAGDVVFGGGAVGGQ